MILKRELKHLKTPRLARNIFSNEYIVNRSYRLGEAKRLPNFDFSSVDGYWFLCEGGGWCFIDQGNGVYSCHFGYIPTSLGIKSLRHTLEALKFIKSKGAKSLIGWVAIEAKETTNFLTKLNFKMTQQKSGDFWLNDKQTKLGLYNYEFINSRSS